MSRTRLGNKHNIGADVSAFGLQPRQDLPVGLPSSMGPTICPGYFSSAGDVLGCLGGPFAQSWVKAGGALRPSNVFPAPKSCQGKSWAPPT
ncbi:hypothetical protein Pyn_08026 [Prunus yedoensis var. nudiflora]|uniref:Uncharacterized protein n=1 Tax=Prunus yedoensis var. nudiflora TaxID=2094558 RepID=A0A314ZMI5_PRUYE|nr:hypothetical protein Pyn_08026 [Prunus yedoensis var. nudiflora]